VALTAGPIPGLTSVAAGTFGPRRGAKAAHIIELMNATGHNDARQHTGAEPHPRDVPAGYPRHYERQIHLRDGRPVFIRPILPVDAPLLGMAIRTADRDTLRRRFLGGPPPVTTTLLAHLTTLDYVDRFALAAADPQTGQGVAIARYEPLGEGVAEIAVAVDPAWRRVGLATALVEMLAEAALERGIHTFSVMYLAENRPVAALCALGGGSGRKLIRQGIAEFAVALDRAQVTAAIRDLDEREHARAESASGGAGCQ
jgi:GNAT superfamily N-acetyltransferase